MEGIDSQLNFVFFDHIRNNIVIPIKKSVIDAAPRSMRALKQSSFSKWSWFSCKEKPQVVKTLIIDLDALRITRPIAPTTCIVFLHFQLTSFSSMAFLFTLRKLVYIFRKMHIIVSSTKSKDIYVTMVPTFNIALCSVEIFSIAKYKVLITMLAISKSITIVRTVIRSTLRFLSFFVSCSNVSLIARLYTDIILNTNMYKVIQKDKLTISSNITCANCVFVTSQ